MPSVDESKAYFSSTEKMMPNKLGASTQPCLTPLLMGYDSEDDPTKMRSLEGGGVTDVLQKAEKS
ncbi:hypothetical protein DPMN_130913 [Dreissena polymorpha]|uniref:Uncharacterized protein n=1 Tax=Dreissena polymorpha TaxID=45954 RepID=A0A9D4H7J7_DREPO|nr:hypothetical protein DPMN_130913 [Dreissena polymorpha]